MKQKSIFTLIELLVVIAIIAILASMLLPALNRARETAKAIKCTSNQKNIGMILQSWINDHDGYMICGSIPDGYKAPWCSKTYNNAGYSWHMTFIREKYVDYQTAPTPHGTIFGCPSYIKGSRTLSNASDWRYWDSHFGWNFYFLGSVDGTGYTFTFHKITEVDRASDTVAFCDSHGGYLMAPAWSSSLSPEWRHGKQNTINATWLDGHVSTLKYGESGCTTSTTIAVSDQRLYYWWLNKKNKR